MHQDNDEISEKLWNRLSNSQKQRLFHNKDDTSHAQEGDAIDIVKDVAKMVPHNHRSPGKDRQLHCFKFPGESYSMSRVFRRPKQQGVLPPRLHTHPPRYQSKDTVMPNLVKYMMSIASVPIGESPRLKWSGLSV